jgi:hypothetical protein
MNLGETGFGLQGHAWGAEPGDRDLAPAWGASDEIAERLFDAGCGEVGAELSQRQVKVEPKVRTYLT